MSKTDIYQRVKSKFFLLESNTLYRFIELLLCQCVNFFI